MYKRTIVYATILALISLYIIFGVGLHIEEMLIFNAKNKEQAENINSVLLNLSYSYITGYVVYLLTLFIPQTKTTNKIMPVVIYRFSIIENELDKCVKSFCYLSDKKVSADTVRILRGYDNSVVDTQIDYNCSLNIDPRIYDDFWHYLDVKISRITPVISDLIEYRDYISSDSLIILEEIRNSDFFEKIRSASGYEQCKDVQKLRELFDNLCFVHDLTQKARMKLL